MVVCVVFAVPLSAFRDEVFGQLYPRQLHGPPRLRRAEDFGINAVEHGGDNGALHVERGDGAEPLHVRTPGDSRGHAPVVGERIAGLLPDGKLGTLADPAVMEVGDDEQPRPHAPLHGLAQPVGEQEERGGGGDGHRVVVERHGDDVRVHEQGDEAGGLQASGGVDEGHVYARVAQQPLHDGGHAGLVVGVARRHVVGDATLAVFADVGLAALEDGMLEVAVHHDGADALRHEVVGEGGAERRLAHAAFLAGECHYGRCLYHAVPCSLVMRKFTVRDAGETKCATLLTARSPFPGYGISGIPPHRDANARKRNG